MNPPCRRFTCVESVVGNGPPNRRTWGARLTLLSLLGVFAIFALYGTCAAASLDGIWAGTTSQGMPVSFVVSANAITSLTVGFHIQGDACTLDASNTINFSSPQPITNNTFSIIVTGAGPTAVSYNIRGMFLQQADGSSATSQGSIQFTLSQSSPNPPCSGSVTVAWDALNQSVPLPLVLLSLNQKAFLPTFRRGDTLRVGLRAHNGGPASNADFYFSILLPNGTALFLTSLSPVNGAVFGPNDDVRSLQPLLANIQLPPGFDATLNEFFSYTFAGNEPPGTYGVFAFFTPSGAFRDGLINAGDIFPVEVEAFLFRP
jgi:hypothetical protein